MSAPDNIADKFVLLLSADWFRPYWSLIGFVPKNGDGSAFQLEIRRLAERMMDGTACYWHIDFSPQRIGETRDAFLEVLARYEGEGSNLRLIRALISGDDSREALTEISSQFWHDYEANLQAINRANLSASAWDQGLVGLTPDLPSMSQDFAILLLCGMTP